MRRFLLTIILTCLVFPFFGKVENTAFRERVYVQTDKQVYLAGEKIQMKLMTLDTERVPLVFSKVAYVELVRDSIARVQIKVALENGVGEGRMSLPVNLPSGYYRLIAYTRYMRNEGTEVFFEKNIGIINTFQSDYYPETAETAVENISSSLSRRDNLAGAVSVQPDKAVYSTRERGELLITGLPENIHTLSVCIAGKEIIETDVSAHFQNIRPADPASFTGEFLPEYEGHIVTGTMINNQTGETVTDNALLIPALSFPGEGIRFYTGEKNEKDEILFFTSGNYGTGQIATVVYDPEENWRIDIQSPFISKFAPKPMPALHIDSVCYGQLLERSVALQASHYFYNDSLENRRISPSAFKLKPTYVYPLDDYTRFTTMREIFIEFILTARFRRNDGVRELQVFLKNGNESYYGTNPLILLDGAPIANHELVYNYDPLLVDTINIYNKQCVFGGYIFEGIVEIKTYRGQMQDVNFGSSIQIIPYESPQAYEDIQVPDYSENKSRHSRIPDSRHTLLWKPDVQTGDEPSLRLPFSTSDLTGDFQATVEGITQDGKIFFSTAIIKVEQ